MFGLTSREMSSDMESNSRESLGDLNEEQLREIGNFGLELFDEYMKNQSERQKAELKHGSTKLLTRYCFSLCSCEIMARAFSS